MPPGGVLKPGMSHTPGRGVRAVSTFDSGLGVTVRVLVGVRVLNEDVFAVLAPSLEVASTAIVYLVLGASALVLVQVSLSADSVPELEFQESVNKAKALMAAADEAMRFSSEANR